MAIAPYQSRYALIEPTLSRSLVPPLPAEPTMHQALMTPRRSARPRWSRPSALLACIAGLAAAWSSPMVQAQQPGGKAGDAAKQPAQPTPPPPAPALADVPATFSGESTVIERGRTAVIPFSAESAPADRTLTGATDDTRIATVIRPPEILAGQSIGFVRLLGVQTGQTTLRVGTGQLRLTVVEPRSPRPGAFEQPRITTPASGSTAWGVIGVGVEFGVLPTTVWRDIRLVLPGGQMLEPVAVTGDDRGPIRHATFSVDLAAIGSGIVELRPRVLARNGEALDGEPVVVRSVVPSADDLRVMESEEWQDAVRPERFQRGRVTVVRDQAASGGAFTSHPSADPPVCFTWEVAEADAGAWYQMVATVAGDFGGGTYPVIGVVVDGNNLPATNGRLAGAAWHRIPVGTPFRIPAGWRTVSPRFENDLNVGRLANRNLRIDKVEILRLRSGRAGNVGRSLATATAGAMQGDMQGGMSAETPTDMGAMASGMQPAGMTDAAGQSMQGMQNMQGMQPAMADAAPAPGTADLSPTAFGLRNETLGADYCSARIAWRSVFDGDIATGPVELEARAFWERMDQVAPPVVDLELNGRRIMTQRSTAARFWVDPAWLTPGSNTLRLLARWNDGRRAFSEPQTLLWNGPDLSGGKPGPGFYRFSLHDDAWDATVRSRSRLDSNQREYRVCGLHADVIARLTLPEDLTGRFAILLEGRGPSGNNPPEVAVGMEVAGTGAQPVGAVRMSATSTIREVGQVDLAAGAKALTVGFGGERYRANAQGRGEPGFWLESVILRQVPEPTAAQASAAAKPTLRVLYPAPGAAWQVHAADAMVVEAWHPAGIDRVELLLPGQEPGQGTTQALLRRTGPVLLPVLPRNAPQPLEPGTHVARLIAVAVGGERTVSEISFTLLAAAPAEGTTYQRALRVADRFAFGPDPATLAGILTAGPEAWLASQLAGPATDADRAALNSASTRFANWRSNDDVPNRALMTALLSHRPARDRFVLFTQNHFTTWGRKVEADRKMIEHAEFFRLGAAPWPDLLLASATSPAMLIYLDQSGSYASRLNENYARELLELHTVSVSGGYEQRDVTALARLLTGMVAARTSDITPAGVQEVRRSEFRFDPNLNDGGPQRVFGLQFPQVDPSARFDRILTMIEALGRHPRTAEYLARKIVEHYVGFPADQTLVDALAKVHFTSGGDPAAMLTELLRQPGFWKAAPRLAHPTDYALRLYRASDRTDPSANGGILGYLRRTRQGLFDCPTPDGHPPEDSAYADTNAMIQRWKLARDSAPALLTVIPARLRAASATTDAAWAQRVIDAAAVRLTGRPLGERSNAAALLLAADLTGTPDERARELVTFVAQAPEASLR